MVFLKSSFFLVLLMANFEIIIAFLWKIKNDYLTFQMFFSVRQRVSIFCIQYYDKVKAVDNGTECNNSKQRSETLNRFTKGFITFKNHISNAVFIAFFSNRALCLSRTCRCRYVHNGLRKQQYILIIFYTVCFTNDCCKNSYTQKCCYLVLS